MDTRTDTLKKLAQIRDSIRFDPSADYLVMFSPMLSTRRFTVPVEDELVLVDRYNGWRWLPGKTATVLNQYDETGHINPGGPPMFVVAAGNEQALEIERLYGIIRRLDA